jgi:hypothetical protein
VGGSEDEVVLVSVIKCCKCWTVSGCCRQVGVVIGLVDNECVVRRLDFSKGVMCVQVLRLLVGVLFWGDEGDGYVHTVL